MTERLKHIAPEWTKILSTYKYIPFRLPEGEKADIRSYAKCIVGESWNWKFDYCELCKICERYAKKFYDLSTIYRLEELTDDEREAMLDAIIAFLDHFEEAHK